MNSLSVGKRKLVYMGVVIALLIPIIALGRPATSAGPDSGGLIAQRRYQEDLGEASLGDVDPASTSMSLVLLGLRGVAANILWMQADHQKETKQWSELEQTIERILLLQPHFQSVWKYQCWNLTYNVSAECDAVADRFFWVKKGLVFLQRGTNRNQQIPELPHDVGDFCGKKIGLADEKVYFRKFFLHDPDVERYKGGPDERINPGGIDNYLRAREWYQRANETAELGKVQQHKMDYPLFYAYPQRCLFDYATARREDAKSEPIERLASLFDESLQAWALGYEEWTTIYGRKIFTVPVFGKIQLDGTDEELAQLAAEDHTTIEEKKQHRDFYQNTTNYRFWKLNCKVESEPEMAEAHRLLIIGRKQYDDDQDMEGAEVSLREGLTRMQDLFDKYKDEKGRLQLAIDNQELAEEAIKSFLIYRQIRTILGNPIDESGDFVMKEVWKHPELQGLIRIQTERFQRLRGGA
jgi:hypothetical protein